MSGSDHLSDQTPGDATTPDGPPDPTPRGLPTVIGRYRVLRLLGKGGFGRVYLAQDDELDRPVAIKVPHAHRVARPEDVDAYLAEARALAHLDHPHIVPVYHFDRTEDGLCYIVSKYIKGTDLARKLRHARPSFVESAELTATVAEALHHAHTRGLFHRDVKPANILLDAAGRPYVTDFGLALREAEFGQGSRFAGTPAYMSPEQARGEGHRVDGRSDIFSLAIVLYELLVGRHPFRGDKADNVLEHIVTAEPRPPRQIDDTIPAELERICLKALAKRASERYTTARDLADDLRHFLKEAAPPVAGAALPRPLQDLGGAATPSATPASDRRPIRVVPKGLRSFDGGDADFFLELLPGPRDRDGLPESIRFWKAAVEATGETAFPVGLLYGPSGCGKSSLVQAGLLPVLGPHVVPVYVEAAAEGTETRLLKAVGRRCLDVPSGQDLADMFAAVRRGRGLPAGKKLLVILDQFEQWLHASRPQEEEAELTRALRQCDGERLQCLLLVRDDFWMAVSSFLRELEVGIVEGRNAAAVDLFTPRHARKVLTAFGRALEALPEAPGELMPEQAGFLDQAVAGLAEGGKVIPVRLALFAEMVKGRPWTPATLRAVGGIEGVGVTFLEETFSAPSALPEHRLHRRAAQGVLKALLPEIGSDIKGHMRSRQALLEASGYADRPADFERLLGLLDGELRLITPTEAVGTGQWAVDSDTVVEPGPCGDGNLSMALGNDALPHEAAAHDSAPGPAPVGHYQLTHDYLVPSLREWLTRKAKETWRGWAHLRLQERTAQWSAGRQRRFLPSLPESVLLGLTVPRATRTPEQRALLRAAARYHLTVWGLAFLPILIAALLVQRYVASLQRASDAQQAQVLVNAVLNASPSDVSDAVKRVGPLREVALPLLRSTFEESPVGSRQQLHAAFALAAFGEAPEEFLIGQIARAPGTEARNLIAALDQARGSPRAELLRRLRQENNSDARARYAIMLLQLGDPAGADEVLNPSADPNGRAAFIHGVREWHGDLRRLSTLLREHEAPGYRSGLCAALGLVDPNSLSLEERKSLEQVLVELYRDAPGGGTHSAAGWALRQWEVDLPPLAAARRPREGQHWFVNHFGMIMLEIPAGSFTMGSQDIPDAKPHHVTLTQALFVADAEVSRGLFRRFLEDPTDLDARQLRTNRKWVANADVPADQPVERVSWFEAVQFCNWLSRQEGRPECYRRTGAVQKTMINGRQIEWDAWDAVSGAEGYRLLTEAEWEYSCRAGSAKDFCFGDRLDWLVNYGVYIVNSDSHAAPVRSRLPNAWGLFDTHGNVAEWCADWYGTYSGDETDPHGPPTGTRRVFRGGGWYSQQASQCRSAARASRLPNDEGYPIGIRVGLSAGASP